MKPRALNQKGLAHYIVPALVVLAVGLIGVAVVAASHADSPTTTTLTTTAAPATPGKNVAILNYTDTTDRNRQSQVPYDFIGSQTINPLLTGETLTYNQGIKGDVTACYFIYVDPPKVGNTTVKVEIANNNNYRTVNLTSTPTNQLQEVCVAPGTKVNPGFSVKNASPVQQNFVIEVYQDVLTWQ